MKGKVKCTCGWSWNKSDSSKKDMYICHECGRDNSNNMKNGGWMDNYNDSKASAPEGMVGDGFSNVGRNYSPAWGGQFQEGGEIPMAQRGNKVIYVESKNHPRYKAYNDSLTAYNRGKYNQHTELTHDDYKILKFKKIGYLPYDKVNVDIKNNPLSDITYEDNDKHFYSTKEKAYPGKVKPIGFNLNRPSLDFYGNVNKNNKEVIYSSVYKKPQQQVIVKPTTTKETTKPTIEKREPVQSLTPLQPIGIQNDFNIEASLPVIRPDAKIPKSYDVSALRYNMKGPSDYYNYNQEGVDYETAMRAKAASDAYNADVEKRYGPQNEYRTPKSAKDAAERLKQLRSEFNITPNYQMGGNVYPVNYVPQAAMGASMPGAVGFTYARTKGIPSNGPYAKKTMASAQNGVDMYDNPLIARMVNNANIDRSYYDPRLNTMNMGSDYNMWRDEETGEPLTGEDLKYQQDKMLAHENYHAMQHKEGRDNYDIAHSTDNEQWARMQKRPEVMSTDAVWNNFYNRSAIENIQDYANKINEVPEARLINQQLLFDKVLDRERYDNPSNLEGEAKFYEDTGVKFQNGGEMRYYQNGLDWKPKGMKDGGWLDQYDEAQDGERVLPNNRALQILANIQKRKQKGISSPNFSNVNIKDERAEAVTKVDNTRTVTPKEQKKITPSKVRDQIQKEVKFMKDWTNSPMYNQMLNNSTRGVEDEQDIKNMRKERLNDFSIEVSDTPYFFDKNTGGSSKTATGNITFYPNAYSDSDVFKGVTSHEISHSQDSRRRPFANISNEYLGTNFRERYIPQSDINMMNKYSKSGALYDVLFNKRKDDDQWDSTRKFFKYVTEPTETRARLNSLRYLAKEYNIYDPYTQKINMDQLEKLRQRAEKLGKDKGFDPYMQLNEQGGYNDEEILNMLNTISQNKNRNQNPNIATAKDGRDIIKDDRGQWAYPGEITEIGSNQITMQGVPYPVLGISDTGDVQMMYPGEDYEFDGEKVTEYPMAKNGLRQEQKGLVNLDNLLNFTNYNKPQPGGWLSKYE